MSNVKIYTAVSEDLSPLIHGEGFCTDMVRYSDYAALEAKCAALAAENAGLKRANEIALKILNDDETMITSLWASSVQAVEVKTQATDAFLAEVRAQAFNDLCSAFVKDATVAGLDDGDIVTVKEATDALLYAAQLRKGGNQ